MYGGQYKQTLNVLAIRDTMKHGPKGRRDETSAFARIAAIAIAIASALAGRFTLPFLTLHSLYLEYYLPLQL